MDKGYSKPLPVVGKHPGDVKVIRFFVHSDPLHTQLPVKLDETGEIIVEIFRTDAYRDFHPTHPLRGAIKRKKLFFLTLSERGGGVSSNPKFP